MRREYGEGKGEENEIGSWRVLHHPPLWLSRRGIGEVEREKSFCKHIRLSLMLLRYPYPTYRRAAGKSKQKTFFASLLARRTRKRIFSSGIFKNLSDNPFDFEKKSPAEACGKKKKTSSGPPTFPFFLSSSSADRH